jgi:outer membrane protein assembly factor BamB
MYVYCAIGGIVGISAEGETAGEIIFETNLFNKNVVAPSPIYLGDGRLFVTAGYGAGSMMLKLKLDGDSFSAESLQTLKPGEGLASEQQTPIFYKGHLFSILPKDAGPLRNQLVCCHPDDLSKIVWSSGKTNRFGLGPYIVADGKFYILSDDGVLTVLRASTREYIQLAQAKVLDGVDAWGPLAIVKGRLLARDSGRLVCIDVRAQS